MSRRNMLIIVSDRLRTSTYNTSLYRWIPHSMLHRDLIDSFFFPCINYMDFFCAKFCNLYPSIM